MLSMLLPDETLAAPSAYTSSQVGVCTFLSSRNRTECQPILDKAVEVMVDLTWNSQPRCTRHWPHSRIHQRNPVNRVCSSVALSISMLPHAWLKQPKVNLMPYELAR